MSGFSGGGPVSGDAAQQAARAQLEQREYHTDDPGVTTRVLHRIGRWLADLFSGGGGSHALLLVVVAIGIVLVLLAVRAGVPRAAHRRADAGDPLAAVPARDHRRIAEQLSADGRHAEALREWLRAAVATIEERGVLSPRPGRTGAATAREAGALLPRAADEMAIATRAFDEIWFGGRPAFADDVVHGRAAADAVRTARTVPGPATDSLALPR